MWARDRTWIAAVAGACAGVLGLTAARSRGDTEVSPKLADLVKPATVDLVEPTVAAREPVRGPGEVAPDWTSLSEIELAHLLHEAHERTFGKRPGHRRLGSAWSHVALENGRGQYIACNNVGNLTIRPHAQVDFFTLRSNPGLRFRAYPSLMDGAIGYWQQIALHYGRALALFDAGAAGQAAKNLADNGYASAPSGPYAEAVEELYSEYEYRIRPQLSFPR